jgi:2-polyprenyl-6-methoxyphenol hydroxylase-like FAD-dependent oxidoreductase
MTVDIIGAGIGGLTAAIALQKKGIKVRIYEQTDELKAVGAGIVLANNAMQVFHKLDLKAKIVNQGNPISAMNITTPNLARLSGIDLKYFEKKHDSRNIAIHRAALQQILTKELKPGTLHLGNKLAEIEGHDSKNILRFSNGNETASKVTLGADGLNSKVRNQIFPNTKIRSASQICWRGIVDYTLPAAYQKELNEAWGKGDRFGFVQIAPHTVYWYALRSFDVESKAYSIKELSHYFSGYNKIIQDIICETPTENMHTATIDDLQPINSWFKGNVCLIGDAAHATTPNMGQGACQAIEDANILAQCLYKYKPEMAFPLFQKLRKPKVQSVVKTSWRIGKIAHWKNPIVTALRNQLIKITPNTLSRRHSAKLFTLETVR